LLERAGIAVRQGVLAGEANRLNEAFNHWIVHHRPFVIVKAAMTVDGKIATAAGESKWINSSASRRLAMRWRQGADAVLVGIGTILADNPKLTVRFCEDTPSKTAGLKRRIVLDSLARTPLDAAVVADDPHHLTTIAVTRAAPPARVAALKKRVRVLIAPVSSRRVPLNWLLRVLGQQAVTSLLVEGGGEVHASFLEQRLVNRICFFYAPKVIGGRDARKAVAGLGAAKWGRVARLGCLEWRRSGPDLLLTGLVKSAGWSQNYV
jgi:diaminohydroxyphosphoribosylaminopyrimidine deaminase/5-amino-6-(5-phosphoribosylamino)uracil reductase